MKVIDLFNKKKKDKDKEEPFDLVRYYKRRLDIMENDYYNLYIKSERLKEENKKFDKIKKYIKENEKEFGSLLDNEKTILRIIDGE